MSHKQPHRMRGQVIYWGPEHRHNKIAVNTITASASTHTHIHTHTTAKLFMALSLSIAFFGWLARHTHTLPSICFSLLYSVCWSDSPTTINKKRNPSSHFPQIPPLLLSLSTICPSHPFSSPLSSPQTTPLFSHFLSHTSTHTEVGAIDKILCVRKETHMHLFCILHRLPAAYKNNRP